MINNGYCHRSHDLIQQKPRVADGNKLLYSYKEAMLSRSVSVSVVAPPTFIGELGHWSFMCSGCGPEKKMRWITNCSQNVETLSIHLQCETPYINNKL